MKEKIFELEKEQQLIEEYIDRFYEKGDGRLKPIRDGIINAEKYLSSHYKICWILKEPYDDAGGGGSFSEMNQDDICKYRVIGSPSWEPLVLVTYSLLNGLLSYDDVLKNDLSEIALSFQQIAYMNIGKISAGTSSGNMVKEYEFWKPILHWQLKKYEPQIIIFGNTFQHFQKDLYITDDEVKEGDSVVYAIKNGKIYIHAYHPAYVPMGIAKNIYVQGIIDVVKNNINNIF